MPDETIKKTIKHIKTDDGYETIYQQTSADIVICKDSKNVQEKVDDAERHHNTQLMSDEGIHGMRYNRNNDMLEFYIDEPGQWVPVLMVGTYITTDSGEIICTRAGEKLSLI